MAKRYTMQELEELGFSKEQIKAVMHNYEHEDQEKKKEEMREKVVSAPITPLIKQTNVPIDNIPINCTESMSVTTIFDLQNYANGKLVRFPDFAEGQPFVARVRRPSMLVLAKQGKIPNTLLASANELFSKGGSGVDRDNDSMLSDIYDIAEIICESALIEPTYQQIRDVGINLSDDQLMAIFNYTQIGIRALDSFR